MNVLVYSGRGVSTEALHHTVYSLRSSVGAFYDVKLVSAISLAREPWEENCSLLVMPGGRDVPYEEELMGRACDRIRRWISSGAGRYLGLCAGAYWACAQVSFEPETPLAVVGARELVLCPAIARGTIFPGFEYGSDRGAHAARIALQREYVNGDEPPTTAATTLSAYYNGGCWFDFADGEWQMREGLAYSLIGAYAEKDDKPAIIAGKLPGHDHWSVLLSGVHLEYSVGELLRQRPRAGPWLDILKEGESTRLILWHCLLRRLGLQVQPSLPLSEEGDICPRPTPLYVSSVEGDLNWLMSRFTGNQWACEVNTFRLFTTPPRVDGGGAEDCVVSDECYPLVACTDIAALRKLPWSFSLEKYYSLWQEAHAHSRAPIVGGTLLYAEYINSTQTILSQNYQLATALPNGAIILGGDQLAGKGRGSNTWLSSKGCLQFTFVLRHEDTTTLSLIQYLVGLAMVEALVREPGYEFLQGLVRLKWPNDIYSCQPGGGDLKKLGGILVNSQTDNDGGFLLLIGFGFNVSDTPWTRSLNELIEEGGRRTGTYALPWGKERVLARFATTFSSMYTRMEADGRGFPFDLYYQHWLHGGQVVFLEEEQMRARIEGIDGSGYLIARPHTDGLLGLLNGARPSPSTSSSSSILSEGGEGPHAQRPFLLQPDGNSFDMMKNLIKRKV